MRVRHGAYGYWTWIAVHSRHNFTFVNGAATPMRAVSENYCKVSAMNTTRAAVVAVLTMLLATTAFAQPGGSGAAGQITSMGGQSVEQGRSSRLRC
jgi:hypothetical protein